MRQTILASFAVLFTLASCHNDEPDTPTQPDPALQAIGYAHDIVADPSNWKNNSALSADLSDRVQDLGILKTHEFQDFDEAVRGLIAFGTTWVSNVGEGEVERFKSDLSHITSTTEASANAKIVGAPPMVPTGGGVEMHTTTQIDAARVQADAEHAIFSSINGLRAAQADEFGKIYAKVQGSYRALRSLLLSKVKPVPKKAEHSFSS